MPNRKLWACLPPPPPPPPPLSAHPPSDTTLMTLRTTDHEMIPSGGVPGAVREATEGAIEFQLVGAIDCSTTTQRLKTPNIWSSVWERVHYANAFKMRIFYSSPPWKIKHGHLLHSQQGSSPSLWTMQEIRVRIPVSERFRASSFRSPKSLYLYRIRQTRRDKHPCSKHTQCSSGRRYCESDITVSRIYHVENRF
jgi:hypothetical protein